MALCLVEVVEPTRPTFESVESILDVKENYTCMFTEEELKG
jgi:hypothetical protein